MADNQLVAQMYYYLHIEKNMGNSIRTLVAQNIGRHYFRNLFFPGRRLSQHQAVSFDVHSDSANQTIQIIQNSSPMVKIVLCNMPFGIHREVNKPIKYITTLRNPIERARSYWKEMYRHRNNSPYWRICEEKNFDIEEICNTQIVLSLTNDQTRIVSGTNQLEIDSQILNFAKNNIRDHFVLIGHMDQTEKFLVRLKKLLEIENSTDVHDNKAPDRDDTPFPDYFDEVMKFYNKYDDELCAWVKEEDFKKRDVECVK
ncbi:sulfotransferase family 2 domain-containing protein [Thalassobaculum litoreum]|uniref:Sulfotransferase family protein n=1 Tax=Thalassobaculum litoreum DSM 18839 TaxID=1123362 RepID=A0A8G2F394_9PROT|nr:sulfotransferase family 2 domain-containing protein [Thalassobaculum litoreum]SDF82386.1 Sulfotransferase family protein [Thalassobaculum litoreum DSM 18839]